MKKFLLPVLCGLLMACSQAKGPEGSYRLTNAPEDAEITLVIKDGRFSGQSAVNRYFGTVRIDKDKISLEPAGLTMMAGPENLMRIEQQYIKDLERINGWKADGTHLTLSSDGTPLFVFEAYDEE
jgi:heat shock protein HslJ